MSSTTTSFPTCCCVGDQPGFKPFVVRTLGEGGRFKIVQLRPPRDEKKMLKELAEYKQAELTRRQRAQRAFMIEQGLVKA